MAINEPQAHIRNYRPEIDGLRCLAVVPVIFYHANLAAFSGGYVGVDIFFVISGYLITSILLNDLTKDKFSITTFYERRVRRIFPALFVVTAATFAASWFILSPGEMRDFSQSVVATMAFASNLLFFLKSGYFTPDVETFPLIHMWSLAVEEQFYIVFPLLLLALYSRKTTALSTVLLLVLLGSLALSIAKQDSSPTFNFFLPFTRAWELMAGALIALHDRRWRGWLKERRQAACLVEGTGLLLILGAIFLYDRTTPFPGWSAIPPVLGTAFIIVASSGGTPVGRLLSNRLLVGIGLLSYSAYLWHQPLFALARSAQGFSLGADTYALLIASTLVLAYITWRFVETPFRARSFLSRRTLFVGAAVLSLLLIGLGALGHISGGFPGRFPPAKLAVAETMALSPKREECHTDGLSYLKPEYACRYLGGDTTWAVLGDSHAIELGYALAERLRLRGEGILHLSFSSCQPALSFDTYIPGCRAWITEAVSQLERQPGISNVLLVFRHSFYLYGDQRESYPAIPDTRPLFLRKLSTEKARAAYWDSFDGLVRRLRAAGKHVYIMAPVPELPTAADHFVFRYKSPDPGNLPGAPMAYYERRHGPTLEQINRFDRMPGVTVLQPTAALCRGRQCASVLGGQALYFDDNHLSLSGARRVLAIEASRGRLP